MLVVKQRLWLPVSGGHNAEYKLGWRFRVVGVSIVRKCRPSSKVRAVVAAPMILAHSATANAGTLPCSILLSTLRLVMCNGVVSCVSLWLLCKAIFLLSSGLGVGRAVRSWLSVVQTSVVCSWCSLKSSSTSGYPTLLLQLAVVLLQLSPQPPPTRPPGTHQRTKKKRSSATIAWIPDHAGRRYECKVRHVDTVSMARPLPDGTWTADCRGPWMLPVPNAAPSHKRPRRSSHSPRQSSLETMPAHIKRMSFQRARKLD